MCKSVSNTRPHNSVTPLTKNNSFASPHCFWYCSPSYPVPSMLNEHKMSHKRSAHNCNWTVRWHVHLSTKALWRLWGYRAWFSIQASAEHGCTDYSFTSIPISMHVTAQQIPCFYLSMFCLFLSHGHSVAYIISPTCNRLQWTKVTFILYHNKFMAIMARRSDSYTADCIKGL